MKNLYKNTDIFRCVHESHRGFKNRISVYHILKEKSCYPHGCFYFRWRCKQLNKKNKCYRGFSFVGRKCFGCREFYEDKIHNFPELQVSEQEYHDFIKSLEEFEEWLQENQYRTIEFTGKVRGVKPHFVQKIYPKANFLSFRGYLLILEEVFLNRLQMEDCVYASLSTPYYQSLNLGKGVVIDGLAQIRVDQGRLVLYKLRRIEKISRGEPPVWNEESVKVAREMATEFEVQPEGCVQCQFGALVDVEYAKDHHSYSRRKLFCLKGISDFRDCYVRTEYCGLDREAQATPEGNCIESKQILVTRRN